MALNIPNVPTFGESLHQGSQTGSSILDAFIRQKKLPFEQDLLKAQAKREEARANLPFGGDIPPGIAGQLVGLEMVKNQYGEDSPQYQQAKTMFDLHQQSEQARINYQNKLSESADKRFSTPLAKTAQEFEDIKHGLLPGTKVPLNDEQREHYQGLYGLKLYKEGTDTKTRERNLFSKNMDITLSKINPEDLTQYSGLQGAAQLKYDQAKSAAGHAPKRYKDYEKSLTAARTLKKQVRQFYGDSITPEVQKGLEELVNPSTWLKSPEVALSNYNAFVDLLKAETKTYQQAGKSPEVYFGENEEPENTTEKNENIARVYKNGKEYRIPPHLVNQALKEGFTSGR